MKSLLSFMILCCIIVSCSQMPFTISKSEKDPFNPDKENWHSSYIWAKSGYLASDGLRCTFYLFKDKNAVKYSILASWFSSNWLFIEKITFLINEKKYEYAVNDNNREVLDNARISETFWINIDANFIKNIKSAKSVLIRLEGKNYIKDLEFDDTGKGYIKRFFTETERYTKQKKKIL